MYFFLLAFMSSACISTVPFSDFTPEVLGVNFPVVALIFLKRSPDLPLVLSSLISWQTLLMEAFLSFRIYRCRSPLSFLYLLSPSSVFLSGLEFLRSAAIATASLEIHGVLFIFLLFGIC